MTKDEALRLALEALESTIGTTLETIDLRRKAITAIKAALEAKDEPVAWMSAHDVGFKRSEFGDTPTVPLYTTPPQRTWVGLTDEEYAKLAEEYGPFPINQIEAKLKEKNT